MEHASASRGTCHESILLCCKAAHGCTSTAHLPGPNRPRPFPSTTGPLNGHEVSGEVKSFRAAAVDEHAKAVGKMTDDSAWRKGVGWRLISFDVQEVLSTGTVRTTMLCVFVGTILRTAPQVLHRLYCTCCSVYLLVQY